MRLETGHGFLDFIGHRRSALGSSGSDNDTISQAFTEEMQTPDDSVGPDQTYVEGCHSRTLRMGLRLGQALVESGGR